LSCGRVPYLSHKQLQVLAYVKLLDFKVHETFLALSGSALLC